MEKNTEPSMDRIPYQEVTNTLRGILIKKGFTEGKADLLAELIATNSLEGIYSHGVNRFSSFIKQVELGQIKVAAEPTLTHQVGSLEQWNGNSGPGPLNAITSVNRAIALARKHQLGCVALANTNHWLRGGTYGWIAAKQKTVLISWTNTIANMPAWGADISKLGNNPLVLAIPYENEAIVLDMALSQYSYGALETHASQGQLLTVPGGYDEQGNLSLDPEVVRRTRKTLPIGYWKGSGLALLLDILATVLSAGFSTSQISENNSETQISQVFIAIDLQRLPQLRSIDATLKNIINDYKKGLTPNSSKPELRYPGEQVVKTRTENLKHGIPILKKTWEQVLAL